jgi:hypothetical protein
MTDTKQCAHCGATMERPIWLSKSDFRKRTYCSRSCASQAAGRRRSDEIAARIPHTKICPQCGKEFGRPAYLSAPRWMERTCCSKACGARAGHAAPRRAGPPPLAQCDCGNAATDRVWIIQGTAQGKILRRRVDVCADCLEMWLEDGATLEVPDVPHARLWKEEEEDYFAPASFANGGRL